MCAYSKATLCRADLDASAREVPTGTPELYWRSAAERFGKLVDTCHEQFGPWHLDRLPFRRKTGHRHARTGASGLLPRSGRLEGAARQPALTLPAPPDRVPAVMCNFRSVADPMLQLDWLVYALRPVRPQEPRWTLSVKPWDGTTMNPKLLESSDLWTSPGPSLCQQDRSLYLLLRLHSV